MFDSVLRYDPIAGAPAVPTVELTDNAAGSVLGSVLGSVPGPVPNSVRGDSEITVTFDGAGRACHIERLFERGSLRLRNPRANGAREAVIVNTGGGITGGDRLSVSVDVAASAHVTMTSQAAEKIYRSDGPASSISTRLHVVEGATLEWLPQETILYDGAAARRELDVRLSAGSHFLAFEAIVLGRAAHGEVVRRLQWRDRWRIRREGRLIYAENVRLEGDASQMMARTALGNGARVVATLVHVAPDAEAHLDAVRAALADARVTAGASAWNGMLVARLSAPDLMHVKTVGAAAIQAITQSAMPRAWSC